MVVRYLLLPTLPLLIGLIGIAALLNPYTALGFFTSFALFAYLTNRYYWHHHASERYDSKLTDRRMEIARDEWVEEVRERKRNGSS